MADKEAEKVKEETVAETPTETVAEAPAETPVEAPVEEAPKERNHRKVRRGYVVSDRMDKTVVVQLEDRMKHPLYGKVMRKTKKVKVHDEENTAGIGDLVVIMETRPLSKTKHWRLVEIAEKAK